MNIRHILLDGERVTLECKKATKGVPNSLWDTYSAFANTYGGTILLGVVEHMDEQNNTKRFEIVGVEDAEKIRKDLWFTVHIASETSQVASSQPTRRCTYATNDHRLHPCLVPNQSQASHHRHMILHRL